MKQAFIIFCVVRLILIPVYAQEFPKEIIANRLTGPLNLDGKVDEEFWKNIEPSGGFLMTEPVEGGQPSYDTEVRIAYDDRNLYISVVLYDDPDGIKAWQKQWDQELDTDDRFRWILDTFDDQRNAFFFEINPAGLQSDGLLTIGQGTSFNKAWNGIWRAWTYIGDFGWSAEVRIPFLSLSFNPSSDTWGINFQRTIRRFNEELMWTGHKRNQGLMRPQDAGKLRGIKGISQGMGLEVVPYAIARRRQEGAGDQAASTLEADMGLDINYNITSNLQASITYNTDFAETEVDDRQINLTRFPLLFPERRSFFLQGASIYEFAPSSRINPFFSRRVGLEGGNPIPITYGGRLLGRIKDYNIGVLHVRTGATETLSPEHFTAARVRKNIFKESSIGLIYTRRSTEDGETLSEPLEDRHTLGTDLELNTSTFLGNKNLQFQAYFVGHNYPLMTVDTTRFWDRTVRGGRINFPNQPWSGHVSYREFGSSYDPDMAFTPRNGFRRLQPAITYSPLFENSGIVRKMTWELHHEHLMDMLWKPLTITTWFSPVDVMFETGDVFSILINYEMQRLEQDFDIFRNGDVVLRMDEKLDYVFWYTEFLINTADYRRVQFASNINMGEFWSGQRQQFNSSLTLRPFAGINLSSDYIFTNVSLPEGQFSTNLVRFRGSFDLTPFVSLMSNIQYDDVTRIIGTNNRFRWIITPGTNLFFVYNHNWIEGPLERTFLTTSSQASVKMTYTHRF